MWIVRLALRRPYTFVVLSILLLIMGPVTILRTPTDIFPNINIPVVSIVWQYAGLSADQMAGRIVTITERTLSTTVNNIEHVESQKSSFNRMRTSVGRSPRSPPFRRPNCGSCRRAQLRHWSLLITHPVFRFCS